MEQGIYNPGFGATWANPDPATYQCVVVLGKIPSAVSSTARRLHNRACPHETVRDDTHMHVRVSHRKTVKF